MPDDPPLTPPEQPYDAWAAWEHDLAQRLLTLSDREGLLIPAPAALGRPARRSGLAARLKKPRIEHAAVQLVRSEDHLRGECVGDDSFGGPFPWTEPEREALERLGWHQPGRGEAPHYIAWFPDDVPAAPYLPEAEAARAARLTVATLRDVLHVADPVGVEIDGV